jgi:hypothetical protein
MCVWLLSVSSNLSPILLPFFSLPLPLPLLVVSWLLLCSHLNLRLFLCLPSILLRSIFLESPTLPTLPSFFPPSPWPFLPALPPILCPSSVSLALPSPSPSDPQFTLPPPSSSLLDDIMYTITTSCLCHAIVYVHRGSLVDFSFARMLDDILPKSFAKTLFSHRLKQIFLNSNMVWTLQNISDLLNKNCGTKVHQFTLGGTKNLLQPPEIRKMHAKQ